MDAVRRRHRARRVFLGSALTVGALAASLLIGALFVAPALRTPASVATSANTRPVVRFKFSAPLAEQLALVGDFKSGDARATPMTRDTATGAWEVSITLPEGRYLYAFVADGKQWLPDPEAPLASADDFARQNSVLVVTLIPFPRQRNEHTSSTANAGGTSARQSHRSSSRTRPPRSRRVARRRRRPP